MENLSKFNHIPTEEILQDIKDTKKEANHFESDLNVLRQDTQNNRVTIYIKESHLAERKNLINTLNKIINYRNKENT